VLLVPLRRWTGPAAKPLQLALVVTREERDIEHVPPVGSLGLRVPRSAGSHRRRRRPALQDPDRGRRGGAVREAGGVADVTAAWPRSAPAGRTCACAARSEDPDERTG